MTTPVDLRAVGERLRADIERCPYDTLIVTQINQDTALAIAALIEAADAWDKADDALAGWFKDKNVPHYYENLAPLQEARKQARDALKDAMEGR